jgi:dynein heavy chain
VKYIGETIPAESPVMFGLHPNAEIGFRLAQADGLFKSVLSLQQRSVDGGAAASVQVGLASPGSLGVQSAWKSSFCQ